MTLESLQDMLATPRPRHSDGPIPIRSVGSLPLRVETLVDVCVFPCSAEASGYLQATIARNFSGPYLRPGKICECHSGGRLHVHCSCSVARNRRFVISTFISESTHGRRRYGEKSPYQSPYHVTFHADDVGVFGRSLPSSSSLRRCPPAPGE